MLAEVDELGAQEVVLIAQDLVSYGRDQGQGSLDRSRSCAPPRRGCAWVRLLYLYPTG